MTEHTPDLVETEAKTVEQLEAELAELREQAHDRADAIRAHVDEKLDESLEDFDAFWTGHDKRTRTRVKIMGQIIELPKALPLQFELEARRLQRSKSDDDVRKLVGILFGADAMEKWAEAGMDLDQFKVLLAWGPRRIAGEHVTFGQVAAEVAEAERASEAPDPT